MSLMKSLTRVAAGVMLAKGIGNMMRQTQGGGRPGASSRQTGGGILGDLLGGATASRTGSMGAGGGLGDILGQVLGGGAAGQMGGAGTGRRYGGPNTTGATGGLGGMFDQITRQGRGAGLGGQGGMQGGMQGGLGDLLGGLGGAAAGAGLGGVLGGLLNGPAQRGAQARNDATFGEVFNDSLARGGEPEVAPTAEQNAVAGLMLRAMMMAAKSDGKIDEHEKERLMGQLGDLDEEDRAFIREQMAAPVDPQALAREVPKGLEGQVYAMSLMAIDFDSRAEADYLNGLAQALQLDHQQVNDIHQQVGVQNLYS